MKKILIVALLSVGIASAQYRDVSKLLKPLYKEVNGADFYGASIEPNGMLHITLEYNSTWAIIGAGNGYSAEDIMLSVDVSAIFKPARNIFKKLPEAKTMNVYFVVFEEVRDKYGNLSGKNKKILCKLTLTREKDRLLNWGHIDDLLTASFMSPTAKALLPYLDAFQFGETKK